MRVLQLGKYYPPDLGGVETATRQTADALIGRGHVCDVLAFAHKRAYPPDPPDRRVYRAATPLVLASAPLSAAYVRLFRDLAPRYDAIHAHMPNPLAALAVFLVRPKAKIVLHWHSDVVHQKFLGRLYRPLETWLIDRADLVVGPTERHLSDSMHAARFAGKSAVIPFALDPGFADPERIDREVLADLKARFEGRRVVLAVGRLVPYKGFGHLIEAAAMLPEDVAVLIGGDGPLRAELDERITDLGLCDRVRLAGRIPSHHLTAYLSACDCFCLPSVNRAEMFGIAMIEAMALGKPVVATDLPGSGVPLVNRHEVTGLNVPPGDAKALAGAISRLLTDRDLARRLSEGARGAVRERHAPEVYAAALAGAYGRLSA